MKKLGAVLLALLVMLSLASTVAASETNAPQLSYELLLTDETGMPVTDLRSLSAGAKLNIEIVLSRTDVGGPYDMFGVEFRLFTNGLQYNNDGRTLRSGTAVREEHFLNGDSVGFAWYDMKQVGERTNNPVLAGSWSYTVTDPSAANISVPVALVYITGHTQDIVPVSMATLNLEPDGGTFLSENVSGSYPSGTLVILPDMEKGGYTFAGWSDGATIYPAGSEYTVSGMVTLIAQWEEMERNRYIVLDAKGGQIVGEDITGYYADGMIVTLPDASKEGYKFLGWNDGVNLYYAGDQYTVYNTVILSAEWETLVPAGSEESEDPLKPESPDDPEKPGVEPYTAAAAAVGGGAGLGLLWWLLLLWRRTLVKYSLVTGDVSLYYKNGKLPAEVDVVLYDGAKEYHLNKSGRVEVRHRLRFIKNVTNMSIADVKPGKYKGKLLIHMDGGDKVRKCRIKVLDKKLNSKFRR